jgi:hypothetical protein
MDTPLDQDSPTVKKPHFNTGGPSPRRGVKLSTKTKSLISLKNRGKKRTLEQIEAIRVQSTGRTFPDEVCKRMSEAGKRRILRLKEDTLKYELFRQKMCLIATERRKRQREAYQRRKELENSGQANLADQLGATIIDKFASIACDDCCAAPIIKVETHGL